MSAPCGCQPGTPENGWHETRSPACEEKEMEAWRQMLASIERRELPLHRAWANHGVSCSTCDDGGCRDCTDPA